MIDLDSQIRTLLDERATSAPSPAAVHAVVRRTRRRQISNVVGTALLAAAVVLGVGAGASRLIHMRPDAPRVVPAAIPDGRLATLSRTASVGDVTMHVAGSDGRLCFELSAPRAEPVETCLTRADLDASPFLGYVAVLDRGAAMYGVTSRDAALVRFASTSGRSTRAALADVVAAGPDVRAFLAVSDRRIGRGPLEALDAEGDVVGEPMWTIWGGATLSKETACLCSHLHEAAGGVTPGSR